MTSVASATGCVVSLSPEHGNLLSQGRRAKDAVTSSCRCQGHMAPCTSLQIHPTTRLAISSSMGTWPWAQLLAASSLLFRMEQLPTVASSYSILRGTRKAKTNGLISFPERAQGIPSFAGTLYCVMAQAQQSDRHADLHGTTYFFDGGEIQDRASHVALDVPELAL